MNNFKKILLDSPIAWKGTFLTTFFYGFFYIFMEWLFQVTKPSFMSELSIFGKVEILLFVGSISTSIGLMLISLMFFLHKIRSLVKYEHAIFVIANIPGAAILSTLILILIDNFTYTIFKFGIITSIGIGRGIWGLLFIIIFFLVFPKIINNTNVLEIKLPGKISNRAIILTIVIFLEISIILPILSRINNNRGVEIGNINSSVSELPNIILITADGLNSDHMSLYGYDRDTTPFMTNLGKSSLVSENNFSNSGKTTGSITSMLTGKYPSSTRVLFLPNILRNADSFQHLPGILKSLGYYSVQMGNPSFVDGFEVNMLNGFDEVNNRSSDTKDLANSLNSFLPSESSYFLYETYERIISRFCHIFYINRITNAYFQIVTAKAYNDIDDQHMSQLYSLFGTVDQPVFVHLHWIGTHGPKYYPDKQYFSSGKVIELQDEFDADFYDDSILEFDRAVDKIFNDVLSEDERANSLIIIGSDHGQGFVTNERIPLLIHFPEDMHANTIELNTQNLDIPPTIIDYFGLGKPDWMAGDSLINGLNEQRSIFSFGVEGVDAAWYEISPGSLVPPYYQFGTISVIECGRWYKLNLVKGFNFEKGLIDPYFSKCPDTPKTDNNVLKLMADHLNKNQFDTSSLNEWIIHRDLLEE